MVCASSWRLRFFIPGDVISKFITAKFMRRVSKIIEGYVMKNDAMYRPLEVVDPQVAAAIDNEVRRQHEGLELIASENFVSEAVLEAMGSVFTNKYAEGYPGKRYYGGCEFTDVVEELARERAKKLFGAEHANVQPHAGSQANMEAYAAVLQPGDTILGLNLAHGGHLTHGHHLNFSGKTYRIVPYGVTKETETIDYDDLEKLAEKERPKLIIGGGSAYPRIIDFARMRKIADKVGALFLVDMAHFAGLVAGGVHPSPVPHAQIVTSTTHKTLRGPRAGMILSKGEYGAAIDKVVFPGMQGGPLVHIIAAKAVCFHEAMQPAFRDYAKQIVSNAKVLAETLAAEGFRIISGGTDTHLMLIDVFSKGMLGSEAEKALGAAGITVNKNAIPFDTNPPMKPSGIRIGTPALTTRGMKEGEMRQVGRWIAEVLLHRSDSSVLAKVREQVLELADTFPLYAGRRAKQEVRA
jgi:glycine hydroxymethyltransferase